MPAINFSNFLKEAPIKIVKKGEIILRNGDVSNSFFYVVKGCLRSYTIDPKGKEHVFQFAPEDWIISDQESLMNNNALAILNIDAIEDSEIKILKLSPENNSGKMDIESLKDMNQKLLRRVYTLQKRVIQLLSASARERYLEFIKIYPNLVQRVPQKMIASYLGITPEGLSRVRKELGRKNTSIS